MSITGSKRIYPIAILDEPLTLSTYDYNRDPFGDRVMLTSARRRHFLPGASYHVHHLRGAAVLYDRLPLPLPGVVSRTDRLIEAMSHD